MFEVMLSRNYLVNLKNNIFQKDHPSQKIIPLTEPSPTQINNPVIRKSE